MTDPEALTEEEIADLRCVVEWSEPGDYPIGYKTVNRLLATLDQRTRERDEAQRYPTVDAYERACAALHKQRERAEAAERELEQAEISLGRNDEDEDIRDAIVRLFSRVETTERERGALREALVAVKAQHQPTTAITYIPARIWLQIDAALAQEHK